MQRFWLKRAPSRGKLLYRIMKSDFFSNFRKGGDFVNEFGKPWFKPTNMLYSNSLIKKPFIILYKNK